MLVHGQQAADLRPVKVPEQVDLIENPERTGEMPGGRVEGILDEGLHLDLLVVGAKQAADHVHVTRKVPQGVGGRVETGKPLAGSDPAEEPLAVG